jgi:hypothetical protein
LASHSGIPLKAGIIEVRNIHTIFMPAGLGGARKSDVRARRTEHRARMPHAPKASM